MESSEDSEMTFSNFFVVGAAASGNEVVSDLLSQHPKIFLRSALGSDCLSGRVKGCSKRHENGGSPNGQLALSRSIAARHLLGTTSPSLLYDEHAAEKIAALAPDAKIIVILRHPIERALQQYCEMRADRKEPLPHFHQAVRAEARRISINWPSDWHYLRASFYSHQLQRYLNFFKRRQLHIVIYEALRAFPAETMEALLAFLQLEPSLPRAEFVRARERLSRKGRALQDDERRLLHVFQHDIEATESLIEVDLADRWLASARDLEPYRMPKSTRTSETSARFPVLGY